jgi:hypothetical protein
LVDDSSKSCIEDPKAAKIRKSVQLFERRFYSYLILSVVYGLVFINYIDNIFSGGLGGYHLWLLFMYFFPFLILTALYPRNWQLTIGLGLLVSLMNDVFYGLVRYLLGFNLSLAWYYSVWLIPGNTKLFVLDLGFTILPVYSWMMALSIYLRVVLVVVLLWSWKAKAKIRCINQPKTRRFGYLENWWKKISKI